MINKILVARSDAIGDVVLSFPVVDNLAAAYPEAEIYFLCRERTKEVVAGYPGIKGIIIDDYAEGKSSLRALAQKLKAYKFDLYVSLWKERPYSLIGFLAGIPKRLGPNNAPVSGRLYNLGSPLRENILTRHMSDLNLDLLKPLNIRIDRHWPDLKRKVRPEGKRVAMAVGARGANKLWPPKYFPPVIKWLNERGYQVLLIGGKEEEAIGAAIAHGFDQDQVINQVGKITLSETIAEMAKCSAFLGSDSGPMHIAAALKLPVVAFFFTKNQKPTRWGPLTRNIVLHNAYNCPAVCRSTECSSQTCIESVTPAEAIEALRKVLEGGGYAEPQEIFSHWCQKTFNLLFLEKGWGRSSFPGTLKAYGFNVHLKPLASNFRFLTDYIIANNINIIHVMSSSVGPKEKLLQVYASNFVPSYPILCKNPRKELTDLNSILAYYRSEFEKL